MLSVIPLFQQLSTTSNAKAVGHPSPIESIFWIQSSKEHLFSCFVFLAVSVAIITPSPEIISILFPLVKFCYIFPKDIYSFAFHSYNVFKSWRAFYFFHFPPFFCFVFPFIIIIYFLFLFFLPSFYISLSQNRTPARASRKRPLPNSRRENNGAHPSLV